MPRLKAVFLDNDGVLVENTKKVLVLVIVLVKALSADF